MIWLSCSEPHAMILTVVFPQKWGPGKNNSSLWGCRLGSLDYDDISSSSARLQIFVIPS